MRRFRFRLAPVLRLRAQLERTARRELATAMTALSTLDQQLAAAAQGLRDCAEQSALPGAVGALSKALEDGLRRHQWRLQKKQQEAQKRVDVARGEYAQRARDLKALQKLREQQKTAWRVEALRVEQAELDEIAALARGAKAAQANEEGALR